MKKFFDAVILANREILELINNSTHEDLCKSVSLGAGGDISSKIDLLAEEIFIKHLSSFGNIHSEEIGFVDNNKKDEIIIDPIDGSDNFASNLPYYGTSVAIKRNGTCIGAVIVNLANGDIFIKDENRFEKAKIDNLNFKKVERNKNAKVGIFERAYLSIKTPELMRKNDIKYRSSGAFALSLAYGHNVAFVLFEGKIRAYDVEAGLYMCKNLYIKKSDNLLFISQNKKIFGKIAKFI